MPDQSSAASEHAIIQEITGPLETLPDDPVSLVHADFPTALRGYDRVAVDQYVQQMSQLVAELQATRSPEAAVRRALERVGEQISGILQRAHETAEDITAQSRREAEGRLEQARGEAARIAGAAEQRVKDLDGDTDRIWLERQRIVADAEDLAGQLLALAKSAADRFPADDGVAETTDETAPYDEEAPTAVPAPSLDEPGQTEGADDEAASDQEPAYRDSAPASEAAEYEDGGYDEDFLDEGEPETEIDDVTKTVAFTPLAPEGDDADVEAHERGRPDESEPPAPGDDQAASQRADENESTAIIPPASQAANRRQHP
ncbi:MAG: DivIVA domain-containing protein [Solirubrobacteraceae bacterium]